MIALLAATPAPSPEPYIPPAQSVTPGIVGFLAVFFIAALTVLLVRDMVKRVRRLRVRAQAQNYYPIPIRRTPGARDTLEAGGQEGPTADAATAQAREPNRTDAESDGFDNGDAPGPADSPAGNSPRG